MRPSIIPWICCFLTDRHRCVKLNRDVSRGSRWLYVDDLTISEATPVKGNSNIQTALDQVCHWASYNDMKLNPKKCKEMVIPFANSDVRIPGLTIAIDRVDLERVQSHKVLGLTLQNNLKWNTHVYEMIVKSSRRLHILRVMKHANVPAAHLRCLYSTLIRSTLEYCCPVWGTSLPAYLSEKLESLQKRALRMILLEVNVCIYFYHIYILFTYIFVALIVSLKLQFTVL